MFISFTLLVLLVLLFFWTKGGMSNSAKHPAVHSIDTYTLAEKIRVDTTIQLVDVRTPLEYRRGFIKPAVNINFLGINFVDQFSSYDKQKPLYLYCRSGSRSYKAAQLLAKAGFTEIYDLKEGIMAWNQ